MKKISLVLPAHNIGGDVIESLKKVKNVVEKFKNKFKFTIYIIDDGSTDNTYLTIEKWAAECELKVILRKNEENIGLVKSLKKIYREVLQEESDYIFKTDLDKDYDQETDIARLLTEIDNSGVEISINILVGQRIYTEDDLKNMEEADEVNNEYTRRKDILEIMEKEFRFNFGEFDPSSVGSQLYKTEILLEVMNYQDKDKKMIESFYEYVRPYGLDVLIPLVAKDKLGKEVKIICIKNQRGYNYGSRSLIKMENRYNTYLEIVGLVKNKNPRDLSRLYGIKEKNMEKLIEEELKKRIPEFNRFKFKIGINNNEAKVIGENGEECYADIENKNISKIADELEPCVRRIIDNHQN